MSSATWNIPSALPTHNLANLSDQELAELRGHVEAEARKRESRQKREVRKQIVELAEQHGINLGNLADTSVKYRDPDNQFNVWSGRGRKPQWIRQALEKGIRLDDLKS